MNAPALGRFVAVTCGLEVEAARRAEDRPRIDIDEVSDTEYSSPEEETTTPDAAYEANEPQAPTVPRSQRSTFRTSRHLGPLAESDQTPRQLQYHHHPRRAVAKSKRPSASTNHRPISRQATHPRTRKAPVLQLTGLAPPRHTSSAPHRPPTPPKMAEANDQNLHWARERLRDLDRFDGKEELTRNK
ncbi:hypothetical protein RhiXN_09443 [Rhizoctonia solani]|uniref:Uncharacterized protein n=1 Tax=Rhizoctonia solani TaxID=456999 RepID=A0A8H8NY54_9AGAM|nr:uncharacterized protein RhiXN_09443 [Rhizoctonia solani]QRW20468.1 hypothetical protein RhiXN_09443 [Rhizoctonia solani]